MMGTDNRISVLRIDLGGSFDFFRIFFFFRSWYNRRCWLLLEFIDLGLGIINLENEVVDLFLEKLNDCVALGDYRITLIDLVFPVMNVSSRAATISSFSVTEAWSYCIWVTCRSAFLK
jgi:hypothetical protein